MSSPTLERLEFLADMYYSFRNPLETELKRRAAKPLDEFPIENEKVLDMIVMVDEALLVILYEYMILASAQTPMQCLLAELPYLSHREFSERIIRVYKTGEIDEPNFAKFQKYGDMPANSRLNIVGDSCNLAFQLDLYHGWNISSDLMPSIHDFFYKMIGATTAVARMWLELPESVRVIPQVKGQTDLSAQAMDIALHKVLSGTMENKYLQQLQNLIGLSAAKEQVEQMLGLLKLHLARKKMGLPQLAISKHMVFTGNPGTGKTTVARLLANIFKELGIVSKGHFIEVDRAGLVGDYLGQTANKTHALVTSAIGGVLFIDEAYTLTASKDDSYGQEAVDTLLKLMEDNRDDLIVIVAGYTEKMKTFIDSNPGLQSRFSQYVHFEDYSPNELVKIFVSLAKEAHMLVNMNVRDDLARLFLALYEKRNEQFGNGRLARNIFEKTLMNQAQRLSNVESPTREQLTVLIETDIPTIL